MAQHAWRFATPSGHAAPASTPCALIGARGSCGHGPHPQGASEARGVAAAALRVPKHAYGGPEPFGTGAALLRWEREAGSLLYDHLRAEREKEWKRLRHQLIIDRSRALDPGELGPERAAEIELTRLKAQFSRFWDLMNEADRPWHYGVVVHLCTELSPYSCERYRSVTAGTMQGILAQRAKAEKAVRELRNDCARLRRRLIRATLRRTVDISGCFTADASPALIVFSICTVGYSRTSVASDLMDGWVASRSPMQHTARPESEEGLAQLRLLLAQVSAGGGIVATELRRLQRSARNTFQDLDYSDHVERLLPLLEETRRFAGVVRRVMLRVVEDLQSELLAFEADTAARRLSRDQVLSYLDELRERELAPAVRSRWPALTPDDHVGWRYPPLSYWPRRDRSLAAPAAAADGLEDAAGADLRGGRESAGTETEEVEEVEEEAEEDGGFAEDGEGGAGSWVRQRGQDQPQRADEWGRRDGWIRVPGAGPGGRGDGARVSERPPGDEPEAAPWGGGRGPWDAGFGDGGGAAGRGPGGGGEMALMFQSFGAGQGEEWAEAGPLPGLFD
ncbi:hypothetical protein GPECTOR_255g641 [Gonium pectorale]|uniref:Uncharacterized protein n=1 Tax=Gonium pectorale TaxID=33097 RepID=A0A150FW76_GONPE|nr:hypothetical protein GPECTOR_255g641 [Gonium pectorale]|eukprot:KXZ41874.1 hypothetical protein GPECTOR_255g641 [Gonium pectorale]